MLSASAEQQGLLLELSKIDSTIQRTKKVLLEVEASQTVEQLRESLLGASERLLQAHSTQENLQAEIGKISNDLELVETRIKQDTEKARQVSSEREQKAVTQELESLSARKSSLEDSELGLMEELETAVKAVENLTQERTSLNLQLEEELSKQHGEALNLSAQISELNIRRAQALSQLGAELAAIYERKASRGTAVAQTLGRDCSACRLAINAVEFESMMAEPAENIPTCPNCDALIIR